MNREIKFRAWDKNQKRMVPDKELQIQSLPDFKAVPINQSLMMLGIVYELMQYTGLKDESGNEIYEGDIWEYKGEKWKISWSNEAALFWLQPTDKKGRTHIPPMNYLDRGVLIGNIHENPELLEKNPA